MAFAKIQEEGLTVFGRVTDRRRALPYCGPYLGSKPVHLRPAPMHRPCRHGFQARKATFLLSIDCRIEISSSSPPGQKETVHCKTPSFNSRRPLRSCSIFLTPTETTGASGAISRARCSGIFRKKIRLIFFPFSKFPTFQKTYSRDQSETKIPANHPKMIVCRPTPRASIGLSHAGMQPPQ